MASPFDVSPLNPSPARQIQIVGREDSDILNARANMMKAQADIDQFREKTDIAWGALDVQRQDSKTNRMNATNKEIEMLYKGREDAATRRMKILEQVDNVDPRAYPALIQYFKKAFPEDASALESLLNDVGTKTSMTGEFENKSSEAAQRNAVTNILRKSSGQPPIGVEQYQGSQLDSFEPNAASNISQGVFSRSGATAPAAPVGASPAGEEDIVFTGLTGASPHIVSLSGTQKEQYAKTQATDRAARETKLEALRPMVDFYNNTFDAAVAEMGGLGSSGLEAMFKGSGAQIYSKIGKMPNVRALGLMSKSLVLQLASYANQGRPTDQDAEAMAGTLMKLDLDSGTNQILRSYMRTIMSGGDTSGKLAGELYAKLNAMREMPDPTMAFKRKYIVTPVKPGE